MVVDMVINMDIIMVTDVMISSLHVFQKEYVC